MGRKTTRHCGFTLIELMIVVLIIGILLAIAGPNLVRTRERSRQRACIANLTQIRGAKDQWCFEKRQPETAVPTDADLFGPGNYIIVKPTCPSNGVYWLRRVNQTPRCSFYNETNFPHSIRSLNEE